MDKIKDSNGPQPIGEVNFKDVKVVIYYDKDSFGGCCWRMRNPDSCYQGLIFRNLETGEMSYPEGAVIPKQNKRDREILPRFIIIDEKEMTDKIKKNILIYLNSNYKLRNGEK